MILYADDSTITWAEKIFKMLKDKSENELCKFENLTKQNRLALNYKKSNGLLFDSCSNKTQKFYSATNNELFGSKNVTKYLGVLIDCKLSWGYHINHFVKQISTARRISSILRYYIPLSVFKKIYFIYAMI